jgi:3-oxoacyl-[acyl-carrier protein] reductase
MSPQPTDRYASFARSRAGGAVVRRLGLPRPPRLRREADRARGEADGAPAGSGPVLSGGHGRIGLKPTTPTTSAATDADRYHALVFDATGIADTAGLRGLYDFFAPVVRSLLPNGRVVVFGTPPALCGPPGEAAAQQALDGFVRSLAKEVGGRGSTANLVYVAPGAEGGIDSTLAFLLSARSAYVSGQSVIVSGTALSTVDVDRPLAGKVAAVTGAARGIGAATARTLARDGATVVAIDLLTAGDELSTVANDAHGTALQLDLTVLDAPARLVRYLTERHGRLDILVHNAGVTRDRTLARMAPDEWDSVLAVNLTVPERITDAVLAAGLIGPGGRLITVSSVTGIAGNRGQTNYATSKAGVIGMVQSLAPLFAKRGLTVNAVAPGFIETAMTKAMPIATREAGRRMNSMVQGGLPIDVAETIAWFASPGSAGVNGNVIRVCGQSLLGA